MWNAVPHWTTSPLFEKYFFEGVLAVFVTNHNFGDTHFLPTSTVSTGPKSSCGPPSVLHEIDHIEQTNNYDLSEKFPTTNFMMNTASLQKVKKIWKFDCIQLWSTNWFLAPTLEGTNFVPIIFPESLEEYHFRTPFVLTKHLLFWEHY